MVLQHMISMKKGLFPGDLLRPLRFLILLLLLISCPAFSDSLQWETNRNRVTADIQSADLLPVLDQIALATGWQVYREPAATHTVSAKFQDLPPGEALERLLGDLNFALVPDPNSVQRLFVFRTSRANATQLINPTLPGKGSARTESRAIPNELLVRLKPGVKIEDIARALGAKVVGRIDGQNAYRLQFDDAQEAQTGRSELAANSDVESVDSNYEIGKPESPRQVLSTSAVPPELQLKPPSDSGKIVIGLVDTAVQSLGPKLDVFLLKQLSVAGDAALDPNVPSHGTAMAETILRSLQSATDGRTSVQILPVDVYGSKPNTTTFDVAAGMVAAANGGANILNLSLGSEGDSPFLKDLIQELNKRNVIIFAAKGNTPTTAAVYPAAYSGVTAVTSTERGQVVPWANRADVPAVGAPAGSVVYYQNRPWYNVGTSVSTAFVSGLAGGYMDANGATTTAAQNHIRSTLAVTTPTASGNSPGGR